MRSEFTSVAAISVLACVLSAPAIAQDALERLEHSLDSPEASAADAPPARGYLGIVVDYRARSADGVRVLVVRSETPAALAGLLAGDRIVAVDGAQTLDIDEFAAAAARLQAGRTVPVEVLRGSRRFEFQVTPAAGAATSSADETTAARVPPEQTSPAPQVSDYGDYRGRLGLVIGPLRTRTYPLLGVGTSWGVIVEDVLPGSPAQRYGVPRGANIVALNRIRVDRVSDLMLLMEQVDPTRPVELTYKYGGRAIHQVIPLNGPEERVDERVFEEVLPPLPLPPPDDRDAAPIPPPLPEEPAPAESKPPEAELRLSPPSVIAEDEKRLETMRRELEELRRRAAALEEALKELRD